MFRSRWTGFPGPLRVTFAVVWSCPEVNVHAEPAGDVNRTTLLAIRMCLVRRGEPIGSKRRVADLVGRARQRHARIATRSTTAVPEACP